MSQNVLNSDDPKATGKSVLDNPAPLRLRAFGDANATRAAIYDNVLRSAREIGPVSNVRHTLTLNNVNYADPEEVSRKKQKEAILSGKSLHRRLRGTWRLTDNTTGKVLDEQNMTIAQVPYMTDRGTFVMNGSDYILRHQMRLNPGVFTRIKENGELEAHVNVLPGKGVSQRYFLDPESGVFKINIGQAKLPLIPVLRAMGVKDTELRDHWGPAILQANAAADDARVIDKLYTRLVRRGDPNAEHPHKRQAVADAIMRMELDPEVTKRTLGTPHKNITPQAIVDTTKKLLRVSRGEVDPDDRDHLAFQTLYGPEDLLGERFAKDKSYLRQLLWRATTKGSLAHIQPGTLTKQLHAALLHSGLGQATEEINPAELLDAQTSVTRLGEGGIPNMEAVPDASRDVQQSHFCYDDDTFVLSDMGWLPWRAVTVNHRLATLEAGKAVFREPTAVLHEHYNGELIGLESKLIDYRVTPNHRMFVSTTKCPDHWFFATAEEVFDRRRRFKASLGAIDYGPGDTVYAVPEPAHNPAHRGQLPYGPMLFAMSDWCVFLGWYLSEGSLSYREGARAVYRVNLSQSNTANPDKCKLIADLLTRMGLSWYYNRGAKAFVISSKHLASHLREFGHAGDKFLPRYLFTQPIAVRKATLEALMLGDGTFDYRYTTTSYQLALGVHELGCSLGYQAAIYPMDSPSHVANPQYNPRWRVSVRRGGKQIVICREQAQFIRNEFKKRGHYREQYDGMIHCAQVSGGLLYVMRNGKAMWSGNSYIDPIRTPESFRVGIDTRLAVAARKGNDGRIYAPLVDVKSGRTSYKSPQDLTDKIIAFPGEMAKGTPYVAAQARGSTRFVPREKVDFELPHFENAFSPLANMIPLKSAVKGQRMAMGSRYLAQALPLVHRESPHVQSGVPGSNGQRSFEEEFAHHLGAVHAKGQGRVTKITPDEIHVKYADGTSQKHELYNNFPYARKSVSGNTQIFIRRDGRTISCCIADYEWNDGDLTLSVDKHTKQSAWLPVKARTRHENDKRLLLVRTNSGREVIVTEDHSLVTMGDDGWLAPIYPLDCIVNRTRLPVALAVPHSCDDCDVDYVRLGLLVGLYLSEGHIPAAQPGLITIAVQPDVRANEVIQLLYDLGHHPYRNGGSVCFTDHKRSDYLRENFGHMAHGKDIPNWVLDAPTGFRRAIINGYMAGDGCLSESRGGPSVCAVSVSRMLRDGIVDVLATLGVFTTMWDAPRTHLNHNWHDAYGFTVIRKHLYKLPRWFFYNDREQRFNELQKEQYRASTFDLVPVSVATRSLLYDGFDVVPPYIYKTAHTGAVAKQRLTNATGVYGDWGRSDVMWDKIVSITPAPHEQYVYDLCVMGSESFAVCHGLIVHNTFIHNEPVVNVGQAVKEGQLLAGSNFTDNTGAAALGLNARIAFVPMAGANYEDAAVISESMRKRLASEHMYQTDQDWTDKHAKGKRGYIGLFPGNYDRRTLANMDDRGVVRPGTTLQYGDPIVLAAEMREMTHSKVHRGRKPSYADKTQTWDHHAPGVVTDVVHTGNGATVAIKSINEINVGDKLSNRFGGKGVVSLILPDEQMPHDAGGKPYEMLLNPLGVISRINPAQIAEAVLGKIAAKTGRKYKVEDFSNIGDLVEFTRKEAEKYGVKDKEPIFDPKTGRQIKDPFTGKDPLSGYQFILKLHHTSEAKGQGRGTGAYTSEEVPAKGGPEGSKRIALLESNALLSHGASEVLRDAHLIRGQKNENYWQAYMSGYRPPDPQVPFVYRKFIHTLQAAGINPVREGGQMHIMALTDKDVTRMAGDREIQNPETVDWKEGLKPRKGGLFDPELTGGHNGTRWSYIKLHEPMPNPAFEEPIRRLLGLTQAKLEGVIAGQDEYNGQTGSRAIWNALKNVDVKKELQRARTEIKGSRATARDAAIRRLGYLKTLDRLDMRPQDWMQTKVPVLPPAFRPVSVMAGSGTQLVSDPNYLYRELLEANDVLKQLHGQVDDLSQERLNVYNAFKGVVGLGDPIQPKNQERRVKGLLRHVFGTSPKLGVVQRQLLGATVDVVGRAVITPNPDLDMDHVGLPEAKAWNVYQNFIIRRLVRRGVPRLEAVQAVKDRKPIAKDAMMDEMKERPVIISRAPVLHKFGIQAFRPRLTRGDVMEISPLVTKGFNADFDGDTMNYHVPASEEAKREAVEKMLPSRNLFGIADFGVHYVPSQEYTGGLYAATTARDKSVKRPRVFVTVADARAAYERGEIGAETPVEIIKH